MFIQVHLNTRYSEDSKQKYLKKKDSIVIDMLHFMVHIFAHNQLTSIFLNIYIVFIV